MAKQEHAISRSLSRCSSLGSASCKNVVGRFGAEFNFRMSHVKRQKTSASPPTPKSTPKR
eukprot:3048571-Amphidinium_carterae.1